MVMLFGHPTPTGGYHPRGHATLEGNCLKVKLASGKYYRIEVDGSLPHLQPFACDPAKAGTEPPRQQRQPLARAPKNQVPQARQLGRPSTARMEETEQVNSHSSANDECEDLTEEDLRRLRGEMPLSTKPKKRWR
jgi:ubiquitin